MDGNVDDMDIEVAEGQRPDDDNQSVLLSIEYNDPNLVKLRVGYEGCIPRDGNWLEFGRSIGAHTHLRDLSLDFRPVFQNRMMVCPPVYPTQQELEFFFTGLAVNTSIQKLSLNSCQLSGTMFSTLILFFKKNTSFHHLAISQSSQRDHRYINLLSIALSEFNSLKEFSFGHSIKMNH